MKVDSILVRRKWEPYIWLLPSIILMTVFVIFPIMIVFKLAFSEISKAGIVGDFVGFQNFVDAVRAPAFGPVMINTFIWVISVVGLSTLIGFIMAMVLNQQFVGRKIARSIVVFPWATSLVIQASIWNYIIKYEYGNLNNVLLNMGVIKQAINWRATYQIEFMWECGVGIFVTIPFVTFCVLSGLQSIDAAYYEAANKTDTLITYLYMLAFYDQKKGPATALSVIGFTILCLVSGAYMMMTMKKEDA